MKRVERKALFIKRASAAPLCVTVESTPKQLRGQAAFLSETHFLYFHYQRHKLPTTCLYLIAATWLLLD